MFLVLFALAAALPAAAFTGLAATGAAMGLQNVAEKRRLEETMGLAEALAPEMPEGIADQMAREQFGARTPMKIGGREFLVTEVQRRQVEAALEDEGPGKLLAICQQIVQENAQAT